VWAVKSKLLFEVSIAVGVNDVISLKEMLEINKNFQVAPEIKLNLAHNTEFYRVSLVADFYHQRDVKINYGKISTYLVSGSNTTKPQVYSIAPLKINETIQITKEFAINPQIRLTDTTSISIGSYTYTKEYQKLHPQIIGHFVAGQWALWEYNTTNGIDDVIGTQLMDH
jgi:hypothetical protein